MRERLALPFAALALVGVSTTVLAADHLDSPALTADPSTDITDVYAWKTGTKSYFVLNVFPLASATSKFSDAAQYVLHTTSRTAFGAATGTDLNIMCIFDAQQIASCWAGTEYVHGDASATKGLSSASGKMKVFAGVRDDPFFFNLDGFHDAVAAIEAQPGLVPNAAGCPQLGNTFSAAVVNRLSSTQGGTMPPKDFFADKNVLSIVIELDTTLLTVGGPIVGVWASTNH